MIEVEHEIRTHQASLTYRRYGPVRAIWGCCGAGVGVVWTVWDFSVALDFWRFYIRGGGMGGNLVSNCVQPLVDY